MTPRFLAICSAVALALMLPACGGSSTPTTTTPTTTLPACTQSTLFQGSSPIPSTTLVRAPSFATGTAGRLDVTLDWTFTSSSMGVYVVPQGSCTLDQFNARTCTFLVRSDSGSKPRKVSGSNVAAGTYDLLVANFSSQDESASALVVLSSSSCPSVASVGASRDTGQVVGRTAVFR